MRTLARRTLLKAAGWLPGALRAGGSAGALQHRGVDCILYPAVPPGLVPGSAVPCYARRSGSLVRLGNGFLEIEVSADSGVVTAVANKLTGRNHALEDDQTGFASGAAEGWLAGGSRLPRFTVSISDSNTTSRIVLEEVREGMAVAVSYEIRQGQFWIERRIAVKRSQDIEFNRLIYGKLQVQGGKVNVLELGKFDRPRLVSHDGGGLFAGVGWWFYSVDSGGVYQNSEMAYVAQGRFESEPWYLGVFAAEEGEPYPGWLWYKSFLELRKAAWDKQTSWNYWNAGWGQWGIDIDDPSAPAYINLAQGLGVRGIAFGSGNAGKGVPAYTKLARESSVARNNLALLKKYDMAGGVLEPGGLKESWTDAAVIETKLKQLKEYAGQGYRAMHFDFFATVDTFAAHRNVARYFRAARERLDYTECHLGMAAYGPQFQREVLLNHPTDTRGNEISAFSSDWVTFLGFRHSRRGWQRRYQYLMPEYGFYYFATHYSNWGHPRRYTDPEPQQFLYGPHAYCGVAFNFHDSFGFRDALVAASAFSPYGVLGHIELRMPERDLAFARDFLRWAAMHVEVLRPARVCFEDEDACVVSKLRGGRGAIYLLNYSPGKRRFRLTLPRDGGMFQIRPVYPNQLTLIRKRAGEVFEFEVRGESPAILEINGGLRSLPPENAGAFPIDLEDWSALGDGWETAFRLPDIRQSLVAAPDANLPKELLSLDQEAEDTILGVMGRGRLPDLFLRAHGFRDGRLVDTWKFAPWAFADRVWLVYRPAKPPLLSDPLPGARINGKAVPLVPRVDYRPKQIAEWKCPLFFADVTEHCRYGERNSIVLGGLREPKPACCYLVSVAERT